MKITNRYTASVIFESPCSTMIGTLREARAAGADLRDANLRDANLRGADLRDADLRDADLHGANLRDANLHDANLRDANLRDANLRGADLHDANLRGADLHDANLRGADLHGADLRGANLRGADLHDADLHDADLHGADLHDANLRGADLHGADLRGADLEPVRVDFLAQVLNLPNELEFLRDAITGGRINGSTYSDGECGCLAGTLAIAKGIKDYAGTDIKNGCTFTANSASPRERFFLAIKKGDTPENNGASQLALQWTDEAIKIRDNIRKTAAK